MPAPPLPFTSGRNLTEMTVKIVSWLLLLQLLEPAHPLGTAIPAGVAAVLVMSLPTASERAATRAQAHPVRDRLVVATVMACVVVALAAYERSGGHPHGGASALIAGSALVASLLGAVVSFSALRGLLSDRNREFEAHLLLQAAACSFAVVMGGLLIYSALSLADISELPPAWVVALSGWYVFSGAQVVLRRRLVR